MKTLEIVLKILIVLQFFVGTFLWFVVLPGTDEGYERFLKYIPPEDETNSVCEIEGKKIQRDNRKQSPGILNEYFNGGICFYIESSFYYTESAKSNYFGKIFDFQSPSTCNDQDFFPKIVIAESYDKYIFYYTKEPQNGFTISQNPFSKKIVFRQASESDLKKIENKLCGFGI